MNSQKLNYSISIIIIISAMIMLFRWSIKHDDQIIIAAQNYENCVRDQYKTTPSAYYYNNGEYPVCK